MRIIGVICRITKKLSCRDALLTLFTSLYRSWFQYDCVVLNCISKSDRALPEGAQRKMVHVLFYRYISGVSYTYMAVANMIQLGILNHRRFIADRMFLFKSLHAQTDTPGHPANLWLRAPRYNSVSTRTSHAHADNPPITCTVTPICCL